MCEIAWNIGQHCLFVCELNANRIARLFRFCGRYLEIVRYDCSDPDLRSFEQQAAASRRKPRVARDVTRKLHDLA
jgi:hypothetical protein